MIKIYKEDYNRKDFYSIMGKYFAEPEYKKSLPYITNRDSTVWYLSIVDDEILAFCSYEETKNRIEFKIDYFEENIDDIEELIDRKMEDIQHINKNFETITSNKKIKAIYESYGLEEYKRTNKYFFLRKERHNEQNK